MDESRITFIPGPAGWAEVSVQDATLYARFTLNDDRKTWRMSEIRIYDPASDVLRAIPLARIQSAANSGIPTLGLAMGRKTKEPVDLPAWFDRAKKRASARQEAGRFLLERPE